MNSVEDKSWDDSLKISSMQIRKHSLPGYSERVNLKVNYHIS